ncbi:MAG TPA: cache domain-containing protein [Kofleriaceae bacterium]|jgi:methyl-accepting chemotaxis protein|nr:cache domain-containing protein [Kofleriaceae bacterium]
MQDAPSSSAATDLQPARAQRKTLRLGMVAKASVAMLAVGLLPLILFGAITLIQEGNRIRAEARESLKTNAEQIAARLDEWVDKNVRVLQAVATLPEIRSMKADPQIATLTAISQSYPWMFLVHTIGPDGTDVARNDKHPLTNYADRQYFKDAMNGKDLIWQTLISRTNGKPSLVLAMPIRDGGTIVGVLQAAMAIEDISHIVLTWRAGQTGYAFLVDETGVVIAHAREEYVLSQRRLQDHPLVAAFEADGKPHLAAFVADGAESLGYIQGNRFHWGIAAQQNTAELMAAQRQTLMLGLALLAAAVGLVCFIALLASKLLVRPIVDMTHAADRMSMGELDASIPVAGKDEIGMLAKALERLRKSMVAAMARL